MTVETPAFRCQPRQRQFLKTPADLAFYGGAAGGGKTWSLLYKVIFSGHYLVRGFTAVIFRRTYPEITNGGGLWDQASEIYPRFGGRPKLGDLSYEFPGGARVAFRHLQHEEDKRAWQSSQICYFGFDEVTHFTESQFWYMPSRNRSLCGVRPFIRCACNPEPNWVKDFLAPWVDDEYDGPKAESGELRWFIREDGEIRWVPEGTPDSKSLTFIRASVYDNAVLLEKDPGYIANLRSLLPVEQARLLHGDWNVRREGIVYPGFESCVVDSHPDLLFESGGIDFGHNNPFAGLWGFLDHDDVLWVIGCRYQRQCTIPIHAENIPRGPRYWCDPAQPGSIAELRILGHDVISCVHLPTRGAAGETKSPKLSGIDKVTERMRTGRLKIYRPGCLPLIRELGLYQYDPNKESEEPIDKDNHTCDALRYWIVGLDRNRSAPAATQAVIDRTYAELERAREQREAEAAAAESAAREERLKRLRDDPLNA